ncbi:MAG: DUF2914 domain-containing protein [Candidatus Paceibacterota bacterium]
MMNKIIQSERIVALKDWYIQNERRLLPLALLSGFIFDLLTVTRIDRLYENILLIVYMLIAAAAIAVMQLYDSGRLTAPVGNVRREQLLMWLRLTSPFIIQFALGGLFSVFLVLYSQAGSFMVSWIFILLLVGLAIGNELFRDTYQKLSVQVGILFFCVFLFSVFFLPIIFLEMGSIMFILSGLLSLLLIFLYIYWLSWLAPDLLEGCRAAVFSTVFGIFALMNIFYFTAVLPPLPLSIQETQLAYSVERINDYQYQLQIPDDTQVNDFLTEWVPFVPDQIHLRSGEPVYFFSSVFAPTDLTLSIAHHWEYFDRESRSWIDAGRISFPLRGGRDEGYRGYTLKHNVFPGRWRVTVESSDGRIISRRNFHIIDVSQSGGYPERTTVIR